MLLKQWGQQYLGAFNELAEVQLEDMDVCGSACSLFTSSEEFVSSGDACLLQLLIVMGSCKPKFNHWF